MVRIHLGTVVITTHNHPRNAIKEGRKEGRKGRRRGRVLVIGGLGEMARSSRRTRIVFSFS